MATSPNQLPDTVDDVYNDLFKEIDALTVDAAQDPDDAALDDALGAAPADTAPAATVSTDPAPAAPVTPAAPATTAVDTQVEAIVKAQFERAQLEQQLQARTAELEALRASSTATPEKSYFDDTDLAALALTPEEEEAYRDNIPVINKLIERTVHTQLQKYDSGRVKKILEDTAALHTQLGQVGSQVSNTSIEAFGLAVNTAMPDLGAKMRTAEWKAFMQKPAPFSNGSATMQQLWEYAESQRNIGAMHEIASAVILAQDPAATMVAPGSARAPAPSPTIVAKRVPYSSYTRAMERQQNGTMTYENFLKFQTKFFEAEAAGLVDENA